MALVYPGDPGSGSTQTQNNNFKNFGSNLNLSCRGNNFQLNTSDPAYQYQTQKLIQNTVRVPSSLYTMNLGALNVYQKPSLLLGIGVNWNQMSDRALPHYQTNSATSQGSFYHGSSLRHTQTRNRPGAGTPGGYGVDIKHNSYYRYLDRLKAKRDIRRGVIPPTYGLPIPFNPAIPVYGGKTVKTSIVSGCDCPADNIRSYRDDAIIYKAYVDPFMFSSEIIYEVGQKIYAQVSLSSPVLEATILDIDTIDNTYTVQFVINSNVAIVNSNQIIPFFPCQCSDKNVLNNNGVSGYEINGVIVDVCTAIDGLNTQNSVELILREVAPII